jgi:hypothetical protein
MKTRNIVAIIAIIVAIILFASPASSGFGWKNPCGKGWSVTYQFGKKKCIKCPIGYNANLTYGCSPGRYMSRYAPPVPPLEAKDIPK